MYLILTEGMEWVPSPLPPATEQAWDRSGITGVYLAPDESVEWFCIRDPKTDQARVVGYAIRKNRIRRTAKKPHLVRVK